MRVKRSDDALTLERSIVGWFIAAGPSTDFASDPLQCYQKEPRKHTNRIGGRIRHGQRVCRRRQDARSCLRMHSLHVATGVPRYPYTSVGITGRFHESVMSISICVSCSGSSDSDISSKEGQDAYCAAVVRPKRLSAQSRYSSTQVSFSRIS